MDVSKDVSALCSKDVSINVGSWTVPTLMAAPGALEFFDTEYGYAIDANNKLSVLRGRFGNLTVQPSGPLQPTWGALSPGGRRGLTPTMASNQHLIQMASAIAAALGNANCSTLTVVKVGGSAASRAHWSAGDNDGPANISHQVSATNKEQFRRVTSGGGATTNVSTVDVGGTCSLVTSTYDASSDLYNSWVDGNPASVNVSNTRDATGVDTFVIGGGWSSGVFTAPTGATIWGILIAIGAWATAERLRLEQAARIYWLGASS